MLAAAEGGRQVFLKPLDADCLLQRQLHPMIKSRLARVRELAAPSVATLTGVERDGENSYLVWSYVDGVNLADWAQTPRDDAAIRSIAREVIEAVMSLHGWGLVHGAIHPRNILVRPSGSICLTHVSPLLWEDVETDIEGVLDVLESLRLADGRTLLEALPGESPSGPGALRELAAGLFTAGAMADVQPQAAGHEKSVRRRAVLLAAIVAAVGVTVAGSIWWANRGASPPAPAATQPAYASTGQHFGGETA